MEEEIKKIEERVLRSNKGIYFGRVPEKEWEWFTKYAAEEWCNDYGICFAFIIKERADLLKEIDFLKECLLNRGKDDKEDLSNL